ncbi:hypothetical protein JCM8097_004070 [Rhodosporidiobolus ruineniae]
MLGGALLVPLLASLAQAHIAPWHPSMYGVGEYFSFDAGDPFAPLGPGWPTQDSWWFRGPATRALSPSSRTYPTGVLDVPAGGQIMLELSCHVAWTSYGWATTEPGSRLDACPGNAGALHSGDPNADDIDPSLLSGCALAIADKDDIEKVGWDDLTVFSVQHDCVKQKDTYFDVPAQMPPCTGEKCICGWFWLANNGTANFYMTAFDCKVSGSPANAPKIAPPQDAAWCEYDPSACVSGAKRPLYAYNAPSNVPYPPDFNNHRPGYHPSWSFPNGAQNDISQATSPASSAVSSSSSLASTSKAASSSSSAAATSSSAVASSSSSSALLSSSSSPSAAARTTTTTTLAPTTSSSSTAAPLLSVGVSVGGLLGKPATTTTTTTSSAIPSVSQAPVNLALKATASASSARYNQLASGAIDGIIGGQMQDNSGVPGQEWATNNGVAGSWLLLTWPSAVTFNQIVLYDRPNVYDQMTGGQLIFDNGASVPVGTLDNGGKIGTYVNLSAPVTTKTLKLNITQVSRYTGNAGLSEIQVFLADSSKFTGAIAPTSSAVASSSAVPSSASSAVASATTSSKATSAAVSSSAAPTTTSAPTTSSTSTAVASTSTKNKAVVTGGIGAPSPTLAALQLQATASASSARGNQPAQGAIDGNVGGQLGDGSGAVEQEWASYNGMVGSWLNLQWPSPVSFNQIVLFDRPNRYDQIYGGSIVFADGTGVTFGQLENYGAVGTFLNFSSTITTTSLKLTVTAVSPRSGNTGLSEIFVYAADASQFPAATKLTPTAQAGSGKRLRARHARDFTGSQSIPAAAEDAAAAEPTSPLVPSVADNATVVDEADDVAQKAMAAPIDLTADNLFDFQGEATPNMILQDEP